ncbi:protein of unknown function [Pararobbsia alpina]
MRRQCPPPLLSARNGYKPLSPKGFNGFLFYWPTFDLPAAASSDPSFFDLARFATATRISATDRERIQISYSLVA